MKVEQASCSQDAHAQWRRKAAHPSPQSSEKNAGRDTSGSRGPVPAQGGEGAESGVTKTVFVKVSNTLPLANSRGHFPGSVAQPSCECPRDNTALPQEHHCPLLVSLLLPWCSSSPPLLLLFSGHVVVLSPWAVLTHPAHTAA